MAPDQLNPAKSDNYRLANEADFLAVMSLYTRLNQHFIETGYRLPSPGNLAEAWLDSFKRTLGRFSNLWVAESEGEVVGFILCRLKRLPSYMGGVLVGEISDVWVSPEVRRSHVGERLCQIGLEWLRGQNVHSVETQVLQGNDESWQFFQKLGFQPEVRLARLLWEDYQGSIDSRQDAAGTSRSGRSDGYADSS